MDRERDMRSESVRAQGPVGIGYGIMGEGGRRASRGTGWTENGNDARATSVQKKHAGMRRHQGFTTQAVSTYHVRRQPLGVVWCGVDLVWEGGYARDPGRHYARMHVTVALERCDWLE